MDSISPGFNELRFSVVAIPSMTLMQHPALPVKNEDGTFVSPLQVLKSDYANPMQQLYLGRDNNSVSWRIFGNAFIEVNPWLGRLQSYFLWTKTCRLWTRCMSLTA